MSHIALYRKYRSQTFGELMGQEHVIRTLQNSLKQGKIAHAYLFTGPRGTGKTSTARLLAKALNCEKGPSAEPCNECEICQSITEGHCMDVIEMDAASESGVEQVREKIVQVTDYAPNYCRYKIFIIDEVHDLSAKAFDALLKTIEEPPAHIVFILATTEFHKVPPTIRSRCVKFDFHRATLAELQHRLQFVCQAEGVPAEPGALAAIARLADGGYRDALSLLEQVLLSNEGDLTLSTVVEQLGLIDTELLDDLLLAMAHQELSRVTQLFDQVSRKGRDPRHVVESLLMRIADLTRAVLGVEVGSAIDSSVEAATKAAASRIGLEKLAHLRTGLLESHKHVREVTIPRIWLEQQLLAIALGPSVPASGMAPARAGAAEAPIQAAGPSFSQRSASPPPTPRTPAPSPPPAVPAKAQAAPEPLEGIHAVWAATVRELSEKSEIARNKLGLTRVLEETESQIRIGFPRQMDLDWLMERPKQQGMISEVFKRMGGPAQLRLVYELAKAKPKAGDGDTTASAEKPLDGENLRQAAIEVLDGL